MARPLRIEYPGAFYHVTCRGNERKEIFRDDSDRHRFISFLSESAEIYSVRLHGYVLMSNHFHLLLETPLGNLGEFMRRFNITYTGYFNRRYKRAGHLYQGRYKSLLVEKDAYLAVVSRYIHLNPVRIASMKEKRADDKLKMLKKYRWSSLPGYIDAKRKEAFIDYAVVLEEYGGDNRKGRQNYLKAISQDIAGTLDIRGEVIGQAILGGGEFAKWVVEKFLVRKEKDRECPPSNELSRYCSKERIIAASEEVLGRDIDAIRSEGGVSRQVVMDLLCRVGGLKGREVGEYFGVDYSTVSVSRKRLRRKMEEEREIRRLVERIEKECQR